MVVAFQASGQEHCFTEWISIRRELSRPVTTSLLSCVSAP